jgi:biopolymer transport protein ExbB/TolQ
MSLSEFFRAGGWVMYPLVFISVSNLSLILYLLTNWIFLTRNPIEFETADQVDDFFFSHERMINWVKDLSGISTLTGLLGTVIGIYTSFQDMKKAGQASLEIFADGISQALITTIYGLIIAIPSLLAFFFIRNLYLRAEKDSLNRLA